MTTDKIVSYSTYMDPKSQELFDRIIKKSIKSLTPIEAHFLRARRDYLTEAQTEQFKSVLEAEMVHSFNAYNLLLEKAKKLGYNGLKAKREVLEEWIKAHS